MNNLYTEPDKFEDADFQENESYEISPVFEIYNEDQQMNFIAWILNMSEQELARGKDFLIEYNTSFRVLWKLLSHVNIYTVVVEDHYVDRVYRDSYYFYYSGKHFSYNRFCKRLCLFNGTLNEHFYDCTCSELEKRFMGTI